MTWTTREETAAATAAEAEGFPCPPQLTTSRHRHRTLLMTSINHFPTPPQGRRQRPTQGPQLTPRQVLPPTRPPQLRVPPSATTSRPTLAPPRTTTLRR